MQAAAEHPQRVQVHLLVSSRAQLGSGQPPSTAPAAQNGHGQGTEAVSSGQVPAAGMALANGHAAGNGSTEPAASSAGTAAGQAELGSLANGDSHADAGKASGDARGASSKPRQNGQPSDASNGGAAHSLNKQQAAAEQSPACQDEHARDKGPVCSADLEQCGHVKLHAGRLDAAYIQQASCQLPLRTCQQLAWAQVPGLVGNACLEVLCIAPPPPLASELPMQHNPTSQC